MTLDGKGFFIWQIRNCEGGDPDLIAQAAEEGDLGHVLIKIADGASRYNVDLKSGLDRVPSVINALREKGLQVWGWHYIYGKSPIAEADIAASRIQQLDLDGYVINAEREFKHPGKDKAASIYMSRLRTALPDLPIALSSYRFPYYHIQYPWNEFLEGCDFIMPQVYWIHATNPGEQLLRCEHEYKSLGYNLPIIPTGAAFLERDWIPSDTEIEEFLKTSRALNVGGF